MPDSTYSVYCHTNTVNGKKYIGITKRIPEKRWGVNGVRYSGQALGNAIEKYGWDNFEHEILMVGLTKEEAEAEEIRLIRELNTIVPFGYNLTTGGNIGYEVSNETKQKLRLVHLGKPKKTEAIEKTASYHRGKTVSEETRRKLSEARKGLKESEEWRRRIGESSKGRKWTEEQRKNYLKSRVYAQGGDCKTARRVAKYTKDGIFIEIYGSVSEAQASIGKNHHVSECCMGKVGSAGGYVWKYVDE